MDPAFWFPTGAPVDIVHPFIAMPMALLHVDLVPIQSLLARPSRETAGR